MFCYCQLLDGHSLRSGPFCVPLDDHPMSSLFVQCTTFRSCRTGFDTPHLPAVVGVWDPLGAPKSDGGCGQVENRCRPPRGLGSSVLSLISGNVTFTSPSGGTTIIPARSSSFFPAFCMYKVTLPCTLDHNSLKRALDWAETSEFLPLTSVHLIPG